MSLGGCCVLCGDAKFGVPKFGAQGSVLEWCHNKEFRACWMQTGDQTPPKAACGVTSPAAFADWEAIGLRLPDQEQYSEVCG